MHRALRYSTFHAFARGLHKSRTTSSVRAPRPRSRRDFGHRSSRGGHDFGRRGIAQCFNAALNSSRYATSSAYVDDASVSPPPSRRIVADGARRATCRGMKLQRHWISDCNYVSAPTRIVARRCWLRASSRASRRPWASASWPTAERSSATSRCARPTPRRMRRATSSRGQARSIPRSFARFRPCSAWAKAAGRRAFGTSRQRAATRGCLPARAPRTKATLRSVRGAIRRADPGSSRRVGTNSSRGVEKNGALRAFMAPTLALSSRGRGPSATSPPFTL